MQRHTMRMFTIFSAVLILGLTGAAVSPAADDATAGGTDAVALCDGPKGGDEDQGKDQQAVRGPEAVALCDGDKGKDTEECPPSDRCP